MTSDSLDSAFSNRDVDFYWDHVTFLVEGRLFRVPLYHFVRGSVDFGSRDYRGNDMIILQCVTVVEFRTFLRYLFPRPLSISTTTNLTKEEWIRILKVATLWKFNEVRKVAVAHLNPLIEGPIESIRLGRSYYIGQWVLNGLADLSTMPEVLSEFKSELIGDKTTVRIYLAREAMKSWNGVGSFHEFLYEELRSRFNDEFADLESREHNYRTKEDIAYDEVLTVEREEKAREMAARVVRETKVERRRSNELQARRGRLGVPQIESPEKPKTTLATKAPRISHGLQKAKQP